MSAMNEFVRSKAVELGEDPLLTDEKLHVQLLSNMLNRINDLENNTTPGGDPTPSTQLEIVDTLIYADDELVSDEIIESNGMILGGMFYYQWRVLKWLSIPGGDSQTDNPVIYVEPAIQPTLFAALTIPGDGVFYYAKGKTSYDLEIEWRYTNGRFRVRQMLHADLEVPYKRPVRKWMPWESGKDHVLGDNDVCRGGIGIPLSLSS